MLAIAAALIGAVGISIQSAAAYARDPGKNMTDIENSETNFKFTQKLKNNCSGFTVCCNTASQDVNLLVIRLCPIDEQ